MKNSRPGQAIYLTSHRPPGKLGVSQDGRNATAGIIVSARISPTCPDMRTTCPRNTQPLAVMAYQVDPSTQDSNSGPRSRREQGLEKHRNTQFSQTKNPENGLTKVQIPVLQRPITPGLFKVVNDFCELRGRQCFSELRRRLRGGSGTPETHAGVRAPEVDCRRMLVENDFRRPPDHLLPSNPGPARV